MSDLIISEAGTAQFPMVRHAAEIGWSPLGPEDARLKRGGDEGTIFREDLQAKLHEFNPWLNDDDVRRIIEAIEALHPTIEGNWEALTWLRGERSWYDESEKRQRPIRVIDFDNPQANSLHVTWEWKIKPPARKGNRADVMFVVNGIPVSIVEHKNPKDGDAIARGLKQIQRYESETPELLGLPQLFNVTHMLDYWYGVTWNATRRGLTRWKRERDEAYRFAVQAFFEPTDFLRTLQQWILFYVEDGETKKTVLREHQCAAIDRVLDRCADKAKRRGLIWHTQGSGKTFTLLTAAKLLLSKSDRFGKATVIVVVDRNDLEGQLSGWVNRLLGEMHQLDIATEKARTKQHLQELLDRDFRGLILSTIHKFDDIRKNSVDRENVYVFIDEAHRSVARELGSYLMGALPNATIVGFTGTPVDSASRGKGTFAIFGLEDDRGYLHKYSIKESIEDETTVPIRHMLTPSEMNVPGERLDREFFALAEADKVTDIAELDAVLRRAVGLRTFLGADERVHNVAKFIAQHFTGNVSPLGYKAFVVAVDRETCAKYKRELDELLGPGIAETVYSPHADDAVDRPLVKKYQLSEEQETAVRKAFKKSDDGPRILIVTDKLLTGYDAPILYCMYLDKPMRNHVLLQAIARVNRPYEDKEGNRKPLGLVVDFVGVLRELKKALEFDSADLTGVVESLDELMAEFLTKIAEARTLYLDAGAGGDGDERLERIAYGRFSDPEERKHFFEAYKHLENLWEILSPDPQLHDHIKTFERLAKLYAAVRVAYADKPDFTADLARKTRSLIQSAAQHHGLGPVAKSVTFDAGTLDALRGDEGPDEGKVFNLVRGLQKEADEDEERAAVLVPLRERAERIVKDMVDRIIDADRALDLLAELAREREIAESSARQSGLSSRAFGLYWALRDEATLAAAGVDPMAFARAAQSLLERYPNAQVNPDEQRLLRRDLYQPLSALSPAEKKRIVDRAMMALFPQY